MDEVVKVHRSFLNRVRGFCYQFSEACKGCMRRSPYNCGECHTVRRANDLVREIDSLRDAEEESYYVANPSVEIEHRIVRAIRQAGRPLSASEIRLDGVTKTQKNRIITRMTGCAKLVRASVGGSRYVYSLGERAEDRYKHNNTNK